MTDSLKVTIIGRPNVGKSTLFNKLVGRKKAIVHNLPGVTRDRIEMKTSWLIHGKTIPADVFDTGGLRGELFSEEIEKQVHTSLRKSDLILFVMDSKTGITPIDEELFRDLKISGALKKTPMILVVNKVDDEKHEERISEFYQLGIEPIVTLSAEHSRGLDLLKETIAELLPEKFKILCDLSDEADRKAREAALVFEEDSPVSDETEAPMRNSVPERIRRIPRIAIMGRPNVGKSTLVNTLLNEERMITSTIAGTTSDSVDSFVTLQDRPYCLVDTAGIRRRNKTEEGLEVLSVVQSRKALEQADVALLLIDAGAGITDQDEKISSLIEDAGCGVILVINKWDLHANNSKFPQKEAAERLRTQMPYVSYAPLIFVSALQGKGLDKLGELVDEILHQRELRIPTHEFTQWVRDESNIHNPKNAKFYLCHQSGRKPPSFTCFVNHPDKIHFSLKRHLINAMRKRWGYMGNPIRLNFLESKGKKASPRK